MPFEQNDMPLLCYLIFLFFSINYICRFTQFLHETELTKKYYLPRQSLSNSRHSVTSCYFLFIILINDVCDNTGIDGKPMTGNLERM